MSAANVRQQVATVATNFRGGELSTYMAAPGGVGPWPGVCVIHNALGMSQNLRGQADWRAGEAYLTAAPDFLDGGTFCGCLRTIMRDFSLGEGPLFDRVDMVRQWLIHHEHSTGKDDPDQSGTRLHLLS